VVRCGLLWLLQHPVLSTTACLPQAAKLLMRLATPGRAAHACLPAAGSQRSTWERACCWAVAYMQLGCRLGPSWWQGVWQPLCTVLFSVIACVLMLVSCSGVHASVLGCLQLCGDGVVVMS
jgi:hypothetical protein